MARLSIVSERAEKKTAGKNTRILDTRDNSLIMVCSLGNIEKETTNFFSMVGLYKKQRLKYCVASCPGLMEVKTLCVFCGPGSPQGVNTGYNETIHHTAELQYGASP